MYGVLGPTGTSVEDADGPKLAAVKRSSREGLAPGVVLFVDTKVEVGRRCLAYEVGNRPRVLKSLGRVKL